MEQPIIVALMACILPFCASYLYLELTKTYPTLPFKGFNLPKAPLPGHHSRSEYR